MKYLVIFGIVLVLAWWWRTSRNKTTAPPQVGQRPAAEPIPVVQCSRCGVHLQHTDLVVGSKGTYCSPEHRALAEP